MAFTVDRRFDSLGKAFRFILDEFAKQPTQRLWHESPSGLLIPEETPKYLFRGECGDFESTKAGRSRPETYRLKNGTPLSHLDEQKLHFLIRDVEDRFTARNDYALDERQAVGLVQHYGLPTEIVDFSGNLGCAFAFAASDNSDVGRVAVAPARSISALGKLVDLSNHPRADRPCRQAAFGVIATEKFIDLKSPAAKSQLNIRWFEFPVSEADRGCLRGKCEDLRRVSDDPSAGFLRFHITEYVEAHGKLSPAVTDWLIERVPIAPRCGRVQGIEAERVVIDHCGSNALACFNEMAEKEQTRRYWSSAHSDRSWDRMAGWTLPPTGSIAIDPRTYHPELYCSTRQRIHNGHGRVGTS